MALSKMGAWLTGSVRNAILKNTFSRSVHRIPQVTYSSSIKETVVQPENSASADKKKKSRQPGIRPELDPNQIQPHALRYKKPKMKLVLQGVDLSKYTHKAIPYPKTGGRGWDGRVQNKRIGGGAKQRFRMLDFTRPAISEDEPLVEKVLLVRYSPLHSADIAMVASGNLKRWIIAEENMKAGDLIRSYADIPKTPVAGKPGDAYPIGALPLGTVVHNIERYEKEGGHFARAAGTSGVTSRRTSDGMVVVKLPSGREASLSEKCVATIGRVSNVGHSKIPIGSAQRNRWFGVRPSSGLFKKKTGYHGRKIKPPKPLITYQKKTKKQLHEMFDT